jgi:hypothetical protein
MHADELPVRTNVAALGAVDQVVLGDWPTHHHPNYTGGAHVVPSTPRRLRRVVKRGYRFAWRLSE